MAKKANNKENTLTAMEATLGLSEAERSLGIGNTKGSLRTLLKLHSTVIASGGTAAEAKASENKAVKHGNAVLKSALRPKGLAATLIAAMAEEEAEASTEAEAPAPAATPAPAKPKKGKAKKAKAEDTFPTFE